MDEAEDNRAIEFCNPEETTVEERRFFFEKVLHTTNSGNAGNCENLSEY